MNDMNDGNLASFLTLSHNLAPSQLENTRQVNFPNLPELTLSHHGKHLTVAGA